MKKSWTKWRARIRNRVKAENSLVAHLQWKRWKKNQRRAAEGLNPVKSTAQHHPEITFTAPASFSLLDNPEGSIQFLRKLQDFDRRRDVFVDLNLVHHITADAIAVLLSIVLKLNARSYMNIRGNYPGGQAAMNTIRESGFDQYLKSSLPHMGRARGAIVKRDFLLEAKKANGVLAGQLIDFAAKDDGNRLRLKTSYGHLLECMGNTHQHAAAQPGSQTWWASVFQDTERKCDCFTFVDMGVGIFNSIELNRRLKLLNLLQNTHPGILADLLQGKIQSSTKLSYRGRGLPSIYKSCRNGHIRRLTIITNDVHADAEADRYTPLPQELKGVVLYWEVPYERS